MRPQTAPDDGQCDGIPVEEIRAELQRLLDSQSFSASARNRRALRYMVERALAEPYKRIPAEALAREIYGRGAGFTSAKDPIVRVEMLRLRSDIDHYYHNSGQSNPLRITIPKGGYRPAFRHPGASGSDAAALPLTPGFKLGILRASLAGWAGRHEEASAAWQELVRAEPGIAANLEERVAREFADKAVTGLLLEGVRRAVEPAG